ncbi:MAG: hypothetical protein MHM6MM_007033 [Cercozoa sp. M6MM]
MRQEAEQHAEADSKRKEVAQARNTAETLSYSSETQLSEFKDKLPKEIVDEIQGAIDALRVAIDDVPLDDMDKSHANLPRLHECTQTLEQKLMQIGKHMNAQQQAQTDTGKDVEDAEFTARPKPE